MQSMRAHADAVLVQQFACGAAKNMIFKHPANQAQFCAVGGLEARRPDAPRPALRSSIDTVIRAQCEET